MFNIIFYKDKKGNEPVKDYIISLKTQKGKDNLIKLHKIQDYLNVLKENGTMAGIPYVKHLDGEIWELRPLKDRVLFFSYNGNNIILLSYFKKMTNKTPKREIEKAKKYMKDYLEIQSFGDAYEGARSLSVYEQMEEFMFLGLRMTRGVSEMDFVRLFGVKMETVYGAVIERLMANGLLKKEGVWLSLTEWGMDVSNFVLSEFLLS